jgi:hypothetical protein
MSGLLQPSDIPIQHWEQVSMDFSTGLPKYEIKMVNMVIVDPLKKYSRFFFVSHLFKASIIATKIKETI